MSVTIRKAVNGYIVSYMPEYDQVSALSAIAHHPQPSDHVFATGAEMLAFVHDSFDLADEHSASDTPEQPSYKHPEKDILNLSEDEDSTEAVIDSEIESVPLVGAGFSVPVEEVKSAFAGFDFVEKELPEGVLAEAVSAIGEKVVITE